MMTQFPQVPFLFIKTENSTHTGIFSVLVIRTYKWSTLCFLYTTYSNADKNEVVVTVQWICCNSRACPMDLLQ